MQFVPVPIIESLERNFLFGIYLLVRMLEI